MLAILFNQILQVMKLGWLRGGSDKGKKEHFGYTKAFEGVQQRYMTEKRHSVDRKGSFQPLGSPLRSRSAR
jgi:hypothetical protein